VYDAAVEAITATDAAVGTVYKACQEAGYVLLVTADHGNAEQMLNADTGAPHTAHTTNPVPFIIAGPKGKGDDAGFVFSEDNEEEEAGALGDVAPTVLEILVSGCEYLQLIDLLTFNGSFALHRVFRSPKVCHDLSSS
jgi:2,3-bisphosphoglycerate-independent phosphoglycerate mutase